MDFYFWLDDVRPIPEKVIDWCFENDVTIVSATSYLEAVVKFTQFIAKDSSYIVDFDHDLGLDRSGYDFAKWLIENEVKPQSFTIHSMNPVGAQNIYQLLTHYGWNYLGR